MRGAVALFLAVFSGCVSIGTHERMLREVRREDFRDLQKWVIEFQAGELSADDLAMLVRGRTSVLEMRGLK